MAGLVYGSVLTPEGLSQVDVASLVTFVPVNTKERPWWAVALEVIAPIAEIGAFFISPFAGALTTLAFTGAQAGAEYAETGRINIGSLVGGAVASVGFAGLGIFGKELGAVTEALLSAGIMAGQNVSQELGNYYQFGIKPDARSLGIDWGIGVGLPLLGAGISQYRVSRLRSRQLLAFDVSSVTKQEAQIAISQIEGLSYNADSQVVVGNRRQLKEVQKAISEFKETSSQLQALVGTKTASEAQTLIETNIRKAIKESAEISDTELDAIIGALGSVEIKSEKDAIRLLSGILGEDRAIQVAVALNRNIETLNAQTRAVLEQATKRESTVLGKINKATKVVSAKAYEYVKMVTPEELAEWLAKQTAKKINKSIKKYWAKYKKVAKKIRSVERLYEQTGGNIINSEVILGYKVIMNDGWENLIQLSFRPEAFKVKDPTAKNYGGKKPVYIRATASQLHKLKGSNFERYADQNINSSKFEYYLEEYAMNRGGKSAGASFLGEILGKSESALAFLPLEQLRDVMRLTSLVNKNFKYFTDAKTWGHRFSKTFAESWKKTVKMTVPHMLPSGRLVNASQPLVRKQLSKMLEGEFSADGIQSSVPSSARRLANNNTRFKGSAREFKATQRHSRQIRRLGRGTYTIFK